jgi:hypothetical protein
MTRVDRLTKPFELVRDAMESRDMTVCTRVGLSSRRPALLVHLEHITDSEILV